MIIKRHGEIHHRKPTPREQFYIEYYQFRKRVNQWGATAKESIRGLKYGAEIYANR